MKPVRIQRSRKEKQQVKAKYCGRPGKYGNPFKVGEYVPKEWSQQFDVVDHVIYFVEPRLKMNAHCAIFLFKKYQLPKLDLT